MTKGEKIVAKYLERLNDPRIHTASAKRSLIDDIDRTLREERKKYTRQIRELKEEISEANSNAGYAADVRRDEREVLERKAGMYQ